MKKLFEYVVVLHEYETINNTKVYKDSEIVLGPSIMLANNEGDVIFKATRDIESRYASDPNNLEIIVRNFVDVDKSSCNKTGATSVYNTSGYHRTDTSYKQTIKNL